jgi:hypothetical protein
MTGQNPTLEEISKSVAEQIVQKLNLKPSAFLDGLVGRMSKSLLGKTNTNQTFLAKSLPQQPIASQKNSVTGIAKKPEPPITQEQKQEPKSSLEKKQELTPILFAGFTPEGLKELTKELPEIIKSGLTKQITNQQEKKKEDKGTFDFPGLGIVKGALGVLSIIGGVFTLLYGLQTEGPFKGLAKLAGKGMLEIGKIFTKPLQLFISNISDFLLEVPMKLIKSFGSSIGGVFEKIGGMLTKAGSGASKLLSPLTTVVQSIGEKLVALPIKLIKSFGSSIGNLFGEVGGDAAKAGLGKLGEFLPKFLKGTTVFLKKIPFIGSLITLGYAVSRFKSGDLVGGGIEVLSGIAGLFPGIGTGVSLALDGLNAFLDMKSGGATGKQTGAKLDLLKGMGKWIEEKIIKLPIIGPAVKSAKSLIAGDWLEALKQFAYINPAFEFLGAMLGDENTSEPTKVATGVVAGTMNWVGEISEWLGEKMTKLPIIGPAIKGIQAILNQDWSEAFKQFAHISPALGMLEQFMQTDIGKAATKDISGGLTKAQEFFSGMKNNILSKVLDYIPETVFGYPLRAKVAELFGIGPKVIIPENAPMSSETPSNPATPIKQVGDAQIKPDGGLVVSSPTEGSLFQISKNDGIIAAPTTDKQTQVKEPGILSFNKAESILEKIANNTGLTNGSVSSLIDGFNNLARELKNSGAINQAPIVNNIVNGQQTQSRPSPAQYANVGNSDISDFRKKFIEGPRFRAA